MTDVLIKILIQFLSTGTGPVTISTTEESGDGDLTADSGEDEEEDTEVGLHVDCHWVGQRVVLVMPAGREAA